MYHSYVALKDDTCYREGVWMENCIRMNISFHNFYFQNIIFYRLNFVFRKYYNLFLHIMNFWHRLHKPSII